MSRALWVILSFGLAGSAAAQNTDELVVPSTFEFNAATVAPLCASAGATAQDITVSFTSATPQFPTGELVVWLSKSGCTSVPDARSAPAWLADTTTLPTDLADGGNFTWPDDLAGESFDARDVVEFAGACDGTALAAAVDDVIELCVAVDSDADDKIVTTEWLGVAEFSVDTEPPPAPDAPRVTPLDGALRLEITTANGDDIVEVGVRIRPADDTNADDCLAWNVPLDKQALVEGSGTIDVEAVNGTTYQLCVQALDEVENEGAPSQVVTGTPQDECDFAECYPDKMGAGFCGAGSGTLAGVAAALSALRRRRGARR